MSKTLSTPLEKLVPINIEKELDQNNNKIMNLVEKHKFTFVDFNYEFVDPFFNINTLDDLGKAENFDHLNASKFNYL